MGRTFAVIADIHGNVDALRAVLADIDAQGLTDIVNLGDLLSGPLAARETADLLMARDSVTIRGNHDRWLVEQAPDEMGASDRAAHDELDRAHLAWLRTLPATLALPPDIFLCHGTPADDNRYWLEHLDAAGLANRRPRPEVEAELGDLDAGLVLCAHTHIPRRVDIPGRSVILNPGSVGCPAYDDDQPVPHVMEAGTAAACYATVERRPHGWRSSMHQVPYDACRMIARAEAAGRMDWASALRSGWMPSRQGARTTPPSADLF